MKVRTIFAETAPALASTIAAFGGSKFDAHHPDEIIMQSVNRSLS